VVALKSAGFLPRTLQVALNNSPLERRGGGEADGVVDYLECTYYPESKSGSDTSGIKPNGVIHFVSASNCVPAVVNEFFPLLQKGTELSEDNLTKITKVSHNVLCEKFASTAKPGDKFQFVRNGFYCTDGKLIFNKTVGLKEGF